MQLDPQQVAAAERAGCRFRPASAAETQRLAMQRRVFFIAGEPYLAVRSDGFCETVGTLEPLIAEGLKTLKEVAPPPLEPMVEPEPMARIEPATQPEPTSEAAAEVAPRRPRAPRKSRLEPAAVPQPVLAEPRPVVAQAIAPATAKPRIREKEQPRWLTAGAERRGRARMHWSARSR